MQAQPAGLSENSAADPISNIKEYLHFEYQKTLDSYVSECCPALRLRPKQKRIYKN